MLRIAGAANGLGRGAYILGPFDNTKRKEVDIGPAEHELEPDSFALGLVLRSPIPPVNSAGEPRTDALILEQELKLFQE